MRWRVSLPVTISPDAAVCSVNVPVFKPRLQQAVALIVILCI